MDENSSTIGNATNNSIPDNINIKENVDKYIYKNLFTLLMYGILFFSLFIAAIMKYMHRDSAVWLYGTSGVHDKNAQVIFVIWIMIVLVSLIGYIFLLCRFLVKLKMVKQLIRYPSTSCTRAVCLKVVDFLKIAYRYTFSVSDVPNHIVNVYVWSKNDYIYDVKAVDEVYIIQFLHKYNIIVMNHRWNTADYFDNSQKLFYDNPFLIHKMNNRQRAILLVGLVIDLPILFYIYNLALENNPPPIPATIIYFMVLIMMMSCIYAMRD